MEHSDVGSVKSDPKLFLDFLKEHRYAVYHKSNIFFRDFQFGLWRFLKENQTRVSYAEMERVAREVLDAWEHQGTIRKINRQSFELTMPEYLTVWPTAGFGGSVGTTPAPSKEKPAPSPPSVAPAARPESTTAAPATDDGDKEAKIAAIRAKMAAAKAGREGAGAVPADATPPSAKADTAPATAPVADADKGAKIAEPQAKMAAAKAKREAQAGQDLPDTQAPRAGSSPAAGKISPAEKAEPSGVPVEEQRHNADPNAPQSRVTPPGETEMPESQTGGIPATSLRQKPELGSEQAREEAQQRAIPPPSGAGDAHRNNEQ